MNHYMLRLTYILGKKITFFVELLQRFKFLKNLDKKVKNVQVTVRSRKL